MNLTLTFYFIFYTYFIANILAYVYLFISCVELELYIYKVMFNSKTLVHYDRDIKNYKKGTYMVFFDFLNVFINILARIHEKKYAYLLKRP